MTRSELKTWLSEYNGKGCSDAVHSWFKLLIEKNLGKSALRSFEDVVYKDKEGWCMPYGEGAKFIDDWARDVKRTRVSLG